MHVCPPQSALTLLIHGEVCVEEHGVAYLRLVKSASLSHGRARSRKRAARWLWVGMLRLVGKAHRHAKQRDEAAR